MEEDDDDDGFEVVNFPPASPPLKTVDGLVTVDLLTYDPPSVFPVIKSIKNAQVLKVHTNNLFEVPDELNRLGNLKHLVLRRNNSKKGQGISNLPSLQGLTNLHTLDVKENPLYRIPPSLFQLVNLVNLDLSYCHLQSLPDEINQLKILKKLRLTGNKDIGQIPFGLTELTHLYAEDCGLKSIPSKIKELSNLEVLVLSNNLLTELPDEFYDLQSMTRCYLDDNNLSSVSSRICNLQQLLMLVLDKNSISQLPDEICNTPNLKCLCVKSNKLTALPAGIAKMPSLEQIFVDKNPLLRPNVHICNQGLSAIRYYFTRSKSVSLMPHNKRVQLVILGESGAGKTSLVKALVWGLPCTQEQQDCSTVGLEFHIWKPDPNDDDLEVRLVDCAGQKRYQLTHYFFIREGSLFMIVVNLESYSSENFRETVQDWLELVIALAPSATILIVPTHTDKCTKTEVRCRCENILSLIKKWEKKRKDTIQRNIDREENSPITFVTETEHDRVLGQLENLARNGPIISSIFTEDLVSENIIRMTPVSNDIGLSGMKELTKEVKRIANNPNLCECVGTELQESWVNMEKCFLKMKDDVHKNSSLSFHKVVELAESVGLRDHDLMMAINYWNSIGELLYFPDIQQLHDVVFLSPRWLSNVLKLLFRHDHKTSLVYDDKFHHICDQFQFDHYRVELSTQAILSADLLRCMWYDVITDETMFNNLITLLKHFGLACKLDNQDLSPSPLPSYSPCRRFLVPWFLRSSMPENIKGKWMSLLSDNEICTKFVIDTGCPTGMLERLVVHCHGLADFLEPWLTGAYMLCEDVHILINLVKRDYSCSLEVIARYSGDSCLYLCIWKALVPILQHGERLLSNLHGVCFRRYSVCPNCVRVHERLPCHHPCDWLRPGKAVFKNNIVCVKCQEKVDINRLIPPSQILNEIFSTSQPVSDVVDTRLFEMLATRLGNDWRPLARELPLSEGEIQNIISDNVGNQREQIVETLKRWKNKQGAAATRQSLVAHLRKIERLDLCPDVFNF